MLSYFSKFSDSVFFNVLCAWNSLITVILLRLFSQEIKACPGPPPPEPDKSVAIPYPTYPPRDVKALVEPLPDIPPCCLLQLHTSPIYQLPSTFWKGVPFFHKKKNGEASFHVVSAVNSPFPSMVLWSKIWKSMKMNEARFFFF